ncbi:hypothetical protein [Bacillus cereus]|uniref:hypothetical protein n=1 Tax=Bacillus cereus TaxID=1396 RepID=UPI0012F7ACE3
MKSVLKEVGNHKIEIHENYTFNQKTNLDQYKQLFEELRESGYLKAHSFSDITWHLYCPVKEKDMRLNFSLGKYNSFILSLKSFVLLRRKSGIKPRTIKDDLWKLKKVITSTDGLRDEEVVKEYFLNKGITEETYRICEILVRYLNFYSLPIKKLVTEIFEGLRYPVSKNRELPPFPDVLNFNDCVNRYFAEHSMEETLRFYPVFLWWTITNIIPLRPIEFLRIKAECLSVRTDGSFWITIPRYKRESSSLNEVSWEQSILIDDKVYQMINNYVLRLEVLNINTEFLVPPLHLINERNRVSWSQETGAVNQEVFYTFLMHFYEEVVENKYDEFHHHKITPGDTRHFAIINLFLQGFNVLTIARLAGHEQITSPGNYFTHARHYATSFVYRLAQMKSEEDISYSMSDGLIGLNDKRVRHAQMNIDSDDDTEKWRRVDYGFCKDIENFPNNCVEDCRLCREHYVFKPNVNEWNEGIQWLENYSNELGNHITDTFNIMAMVSTDTYDSLKGIEKFNENESKSLAVQLFKYLDHKAMVDARILEEQLENE